MKFSQVLLIGLLVRLLIAPFLAHPFDVYRFYFNGQSLINGTLHLSFFLVPYRYAFFLFAFPAGYAFNFITTLIGNTTIPLSSINPALIPGPPWDISLVPGPIFDLLVKAPLILSDAIIAWILFLIIQKQLGSEKLAVAASAAWFLNPFVIWISSAWGMWDTLPALFTVLALYFVLEDRFYLATAATILAFAMKLYPVVVVVPLLILVSRRSEKRVICNMLGIGLVMSLLLFAVSFAGLTDELQGTVTGSAPVGPYFSGLSFWTPLTLFLPAFDQTALSSILVVVLLLAAYVWMYLRKGSGLSTSLAYFVLPTILLLMAFRFIGENFVVWTLPFLAMLAVRDTKMFRLYWLLSAVGLLASISDTFLPYYLLPIAPQVQGYLVPLMAAVQPYRAAPGGAISSGITLGKLLLSALGMSTFLILAAMALRMRSITDEV